MELTWKQKVHFLGGGTELAQNFFGFFENFFEIFPKFSKVFLDEAPAVIVKSDKKKKKKKPKSSGLSFADDDPSEDSTDFKLKKSSR